MPIRFVDKMAATYYTLWPMSEQDVNKKITEAFRELADKVDLALNSASSPPKPETTEAAQAAYEAALQAFNAKGGVSLNSATPGARLEDLLKENPKE